jgi:hypothetical protein
MLDHNDRAEEREAERGADDVRRPEPLGPGRVYWLKLTIAPPRPSWIEAGVSPMIAPITLAVAEILRAVKM